MRDCCVKKNGNVGRKPHVKPTVGANLGFRLAWEKQTPRQRAALQAGDEAVMAYARRLNGRKSDENGYVKGFTREECMKNANV